MKIITLISILFLGVACQEEKGIWDELSGPEREAVRAEARSKCVADNQTRLDALKNNTNFFQSNDWQRNKAFKHELKNGEAVDTLNEIQVWKQDRSANIVYLWVKRTKGSDLDSFFLRIRKDQHEKMATDLLNDLCDRKITVASGSNPLTVTKSYNQTATPNRREFTDTYSLQLIESPLIGGTYRLTRKIVTKKISDDSVVSTVNLNSTFATVAEPEVLGSNPNSYATTYCDIVSPANFADPADRFSLPYSFNCLGSLPGGWDLTI